MRRQSLSLHLQLPAGAECERCIARLQSRVAAIRGVLEAAVTEARTAFHVEFDPEVVTVARIESEARRAGAEIAEQIDHLTLAVEMDCADCARTIEEGLRRERGVLWAAVSFAGGTLHAELERGVTDAEHIASVATAYGARRCTVAGARRSASPNEDDVRAASRSRRVRTLAVAATVALTTAAATINALGMPGYAWLACAAIALGGLPTARAAWHSVRARSLDMNALMTVAVTGAIGIGEWIEGATVVALFAVGNWLQARALERTRRSVAALIGMTAKTATLRRDGMETRVPVEEIGPGDVVIVRPGERIPLDGTVVAGSSSVNEAPITGESLPADKRPGAAVFGGSVNHYGSLDVRVSRHYHDTMLARIIHAVEEAQAQRAPAQQLIDRFAATYTPLVVLAAVAVAIGPPLAQSAGPWLQGAAAPDGIWQEWLLRALALLLIACPCALVISTPVAIVTAIGAASRHGALVKGGVFLERLADVRAVLYDKTGTLTTGEFALEDIVPLSGATAAEVLRAAGAVESRSEHPIGSAIARAAAQHDGSRPARVEGFEAHPGLGARALVDSRPVLVGSPAFLRSQGIDPGEAADAVGRAEASGKTAVIVAEGSRPLGVAVLADRTRADAAEAVERLRHLGIAYQAMLTGDNARVAADVAGRIGLDEFRAGLLPEQKLALVRACRERFGPVAMVGDGINDAPALATADVGIATGAAATDAAIETSDVALLGAGLGRLPYLFELSRRTRSIMRQNVAFSLATKALLLIAAIAIGVPLWLAIAGDVGVSLLVTLNALRLADRPPAAQVTPASAPAIGASPS
ncbi:MAG TPA: cation-translocating P-type ATPase [Chthonomonadales bacterium]|nr:cation-translocating P-type ATPase [Chthonomonadales bacterium]